MNHTNRRRHKNRGLLRISFERLEDRALLAMDVALTGTQVSFVDTGPEIYPLDISVNEFGFLQYNLRTVVDGELISEDPSTDLDTTQPGEQAMLAADATQISVDLTAGGGGGSITGIESGQVDFTGSSLLLDWQTFSANSLTIFGSSGLLRISSGHFLTVSISGVQELMMRYGDGADTILAGSYQAAINATTNGGNDIVVGTNQNDFIFTGVGNDYLDGGRGDDSLSADDSLIPGNDTVYGRAGDDFIYAGFGNDELYGGSGFDTALEELSTGTFIVRNHTLNVDGFMTRDHDIESFLVNGSEGNDLIDASQADGPCVLFGAGGDDTLIGSRFDDSLDGGNGKDSLSGRDGDDQLNGFEDNDILDGGAGDDSLSGDAGNDQLNGGSGQDTLRGGSGNDQLDGGNGDDDLDGDAGSDTILGGGGNDFMSEDADPDGLGDSLDGGNGDDFLQVFSGTNTLRGGGGDDEILAGLGGVDDINGDGGSDRIEASLDDSFAGGAGTDLLILTTGLTTARITNSTITFDGVSRPRLGIENFSIFATASANFDASGYTAGSVTFVGSADADVLIGSENADTLVGSAGNDSLDGRGGNDSLRADADDDIVLGGSGRDEFGFYGLFDNGLPSSPTRQQILDLLFALGIIHDIAQNESVLALIS